MKPYIKPFPLFPVLIVDDEEDVLQAYKMTLRFNGINNLILCSDSRQVLTLLSENKVSAIILDLSMPHLTGLELLESIKEKYPGIPAIVVTASNNVANAVECMKRGAIDYMVKPVEDNRLVSGLRNAIELNELRDENVALQRSLLNQRVKNLEAFSSIVTTSNSMLAIFSYIETIAESTRPVLITGESGTGKELVAHALHAVSGRQGKFVPVNVGGLDDTVFSDTLFGHRKGAFTGADGERRGLVEEASGGTLFLDEIGSLEKASQTKLLRLLQEHEYYPLGSDVCKTLRAAVVAATNEDLHARMKEGRFRNDLYYRLLTHHIEIPPLRERREDIPVLFDHFMMKSSQDSGKARPAVPNGMLSMLNQYDFPGNIRELGALVYDCVAKCQSSTLELAYVKEYIRHQTGADVNVSPTEGSKQFSIPFQGDFPRLKEMEDFLISEAMRKAEGNQYRAAELLGVAQSTVWRRFRK